MKRKSARHKWAEEDGREVIIAVMRMNDTPQWVLDKFCSLGLREAYNKRDAILRMIAHPTFKGEMLSYAPRYGYPSIFSWEYLGQYTYF